MAQKILRCLIVLVLFYANSVAAAPFDVKKANQSLDKIGRELSGPRNPEKLKAGLSRLQKLQEQVKQCEEQASEELVDINKQINESKLTQPEQEDNQLVKYLSGKRKDIINRQSECKILLIKISETTKIYSDIVDNIEKSSRLTIFAPVWENLLESYQIISGDKSIIDKTAFEKIYGTQYWLSHLIFLITAFLGAVIAVKMGHRLINLEKTLEEAKYISEKVRILFIIILKKHLGKLTFLTAFVAYAAVLHYHVDLPITLLLLALLFLTFVLFNMLVEFLVFFREPSEELGLFPIHLGKTLAYRLKAIGWFCFISTIIYVNFYEQIFPQAVNLSARTVFMTLFTLLTCDLIWQLTKWQRLFQRLKSFRFVLVLFLISIMCGLLGLEWLGYHALTNYVITNIVISLGLIFATWVIHFIISTALDAINDNQRKWQNAVRSLLGIKRASVITEIIWIKIAFLSMVWGGLVLALLRIWILTKNEYDNLLASLLYGFTISDITIVPSQIILALMTFTGLSLLTRWIRRDVAIHTQLNRVPGMQHSIAAIVGYVGFSIALLVSLLVAGVNLTGLALIAGALSVGIGFGLQNIVNNFVSGLILLIERPIKPGDRVLVGQHEGYVKSISIRSTVINSLDKMDIILPNSDLISGEVTNLMLDDRYYRLRIFIGVSYDSDLDLVFDTMEKIAYSHPDVLVEDPMKPKILFNKHGDSALEFEMRVILRDVNRRQIVRSQLNTMINQEFRKNKIEIPFPQREITIKSEPAKAPKSTDT